MLASFHFANLFTNSVMLQIYGVPLFTCESILSEQRSFKYSSLKDTVRKTA